MHAEAAKSVTVISSFRPTTINWLIGYLLLFGRLWKEGKPNKHCCLGIKCICISLFWDLLWYITRFYKNNVSLWSAPKFQLQSGTFVIFPKCWKQEKSIPKSLDYCRLVLACFWKIFVRFSVCTYINNNVSFWKM